MSEKSTGFSVEAVRTALAQEQAPIELCDYCQCAIMTVAVEDVAERTRCCSVYCSRQEASLRRRRRGEHGGHSVVPASDS